MKDEVDKIFIAIGMLITLRNDIENNLSQSEWQIWLINHIIKVLES